MNELGITLIPAQSPQAKGRVERLWDTLQSRLPVEFKIAGITNIQYFYTKSFTSLPYFRTNFPISNVAEGWTLFQWSRNVPLPHIQLYLIGVGKVSKAIYINSKTTFHRIISGYCSLIINPPLYIKNKG
jgi:hypothetical protein